MIATRRRWRPSPRRPARRLRSGCQAGPTRPGGEPVSGQRRRPEVEVHPVDPRRQGAVADTSRPPGASRAPGHRPSPHPGSSSRSLSSSAETAKSVISLVSICGGRVRRRPTPGSASGARFHSGDTRTSRSDRPCPGNRPCSADRPPDESCSRVAPSRAVRRRISSPIAPNTRTILRRQGRIARLKALDPLRLGFLNRFDVGGDPDVTRAFVTLAADRAAHCDHRHRRKTDPLAPSRSS